jgi:tRNA uridine 5-carboxymethylaminomethyl modification enzyme
MAVMVEDLTLHGVSEPYRMLTARAEYRLRLRANNASTRLTPLALKAGCVAPARAEWFAERERERACWQNALDQEVSAAELEGGGVRVRRDAGRKRLAEPWLLPDQNPRSDVASEVAEDCAYAPYLERQESELRDLRASSSVPLGPYYPYAKVPGLSAEMVERLSASAPETLSAAQRVRGITPAALAALLVHARHRATQTA